MRWLKRVIARLLGHTTKPSDSLAPQTQTVGLVNQEPITPRGNKRSVQATKPQSKSPAQPRSQKKQKPAKSTTQASKDTSKKQEPAQTVKSRTTGGNSTRTRVSKTPQRAKSAPKRKP